MKSESATPLAWWLQQGSESCSGCEAMLHVEALVICSSCDRPFCLICLPAEADMRLCASCQREEE